MATARLVNLVANATMEGLKAANSTAGFIGKNLTAEPDTGENTDHESGVHLISFRWEELGSFVTIFAFAVFSGMIKILFHHIHFLSSRIPESCLLVLVGIAFGALIDFVEPNVFPEFGPDLFFHWLLPPIILEAAYSLYHRAFLDNIRTILLFAVVGTAFNFLVIGGLLVGVQKSGFMGRISHHNTTYNDLKYKLKPVDIFTFSSLISAVDPVAVLAIFQEVGVNSDLYYIVFGESLLNDGVAVVFYNMMIAFTGIVADDRPIELMDYGLGLLSFLTIALGGLAVGVVFGLFTGLLTRATREVEIVEPLAVLGTAFASYYLAEVFHWSGIISLIGCGITQAHYSFRNISEASHTTVEMFSKMLSSTMDSIIFLYLGKALLGHSTTWVWDIQVGFLVWSLVLCLVVRFLGVYLFTFMVNRSRIKPINLQEQFIMAYGGLRGAVGFSLVLGIDRNQVPTADMLVSTTLLVVMSTIWIQGSTIKPLVNLLNIDKAAVAKEQRTLMSELNESVFEAITAGVRIVADNGHGLGRQLLAKFNKFDQRYLMRIFTRNQHPRHNEMKQLFEELTMTDYLNNVYNNNRPPHGKDNKGFEVEHHRGGPADDLPPVITVMEDGTPAAANGGLLHRNGSLSNGTATPPLAAVLDPLSYLIPVVAQQQHQHHLRKVSVKHSVAGWSPKRGSTGGGDSGNELNILRGALLQNKQSGMELTEDDLRLLQVQTQIRKLSTSSGLMFPEGTRSRTISESMHHPVRHFSQ